MRRVISLWFPHFQTDRQSRPGGGSPDPEHPFVTINAVSGGQRISGANGPALAAGITPGLTLADARALVPSLRTAETDTEADIRALDHLADWSLRWTPWTAIDGLEAGGGASLWLDITGCAHLFGGENALLASMVECFSRLGFASRPGLADGKGAAWAAARFFDIDQPYGLIPEGAGRQILPSLPIEALRLTLATTETLRRLGLRTISDLLALPRAPLAARFGRETALRLDQTMGRQDEPFSPRRPQANDSVQLTLAEPIGLLDDLRAALDQALSSLCQHLEASDRGARHLLLEVFLVDGTVTRREIGTALPTRNPAQLARLFRDRIEDIDAGFGIEALILSAPLTAAAKKGQASLAEEIKKSSQLIENNREINTLLDLFNGRFGTRSIVSPQPCESHQPDRSTLLLPPLHRPMNSSVAMGWPSHTQRPPQLIAIPEPIHLLEEQGAIPPRVFRWRRQTLRLTNWQGPERISAEWWHGAKPPAASIGRDYWRAEDDKGRRLWLFRNNKGWFVHGTFP